MNKKQQHYGYVRELQNDASPGIMSRGQTENCTWLQKQSCGNRIFIVH